MKRTRPSTPLSFTPHLERRSQHTVPHNGYYHPIVQMFGRIDELLQAFAGVQVPRHR